MYLLSMETVLSLISVGVTSPTPCDGTMFLTKKLFANTSLIFSNYDYKLAIGFEDFFFEWKSNLKDYTAKIDFDYFLNDRNTITFGLSSTFHIIDPGRVSLKDETQDESVQITKAHSLDHAIYISNDQRINEKISLQYGGRLSIFQNIGTGVSYTFDEQFERTDSTFHGRGDIYNTYVRFEPRASAKYQLNATSSVKLSYARNTQYLQLASNSVSGTPLDVWFPSSPNIKPQISDQVSAGYFRNFLGNELETSIEVFYKNLQNQVDFCRSCGATLERGIRRRTTRRTCLGLWSRVTH